MTSPPIREEHFMPLIFSACEIERRPRGASRAKLAPTFVSGQLFLWELRANAWRMARYRVI
jgi:hypothetical protein